MEIITIVNGKQLRDQMIIDPSSGLVMSQEDYKELLQALLEA